METAEETIVRLGAELKASRAAGELPTLSWLMALESLPVSRDEALAAVEAVTEPKAFEWCVELM